MEATITNPHGAFGQVPLGQGHAADSFRCVTTAINRFDLVTFGWDATEQEVTVKAAVTGDTAGLAIGVALEDIAVGGKGLCQYAGIAYVDVGANAPAAGNGLTTSAVAGVADGAAVAVAHTGRYLAAKSTYFGVANLAPVWLGL